MNDVQKHLLRINSDVKKLKDEVAAITHISESGLISLIEVSLGTFESVCIPVPTIPEKIYSYQTRGDDRDIRVDKDYIYLK